MSVKSNSNKYDYFVSTACHYAAQHVAQGSTPAPVNLHHYEDFPAAQRLLAATLLRTLQHADKELSRFISLFNKGNNHAVLLKDYDELFACLRPLLKKSGTPAVCFPQLKDVNELNNKYQHVLYYELGLPYFLQKEKIALEESAPVQIFEPDLLLTDSGSIFFSALSSPALAQLHSTGIHLFVTTIDRIMDSSACAELYADMRGAFASSKGMQVIYGAHDTAENHLLIVDNRRTEVLRHPALRPALTCMRCGRCQKVCPVLQTVGEEAYDNIIVGPMAHIMLPWLEHATEESHIPHTCLLCGRCENVCPLQLPIRQMVMATRSALVEEDCMDKAYTRRLKNTKKLLSSRTKMNKSPLYKRLNMGLKESSDVKKNFLLPPFAKSTFNKLYHK